MSKPGTNRKRRILGGYRAGNDGACNKKNQAGEYNSFYNPEVKGAGTSHEEFPMAFMLEGGPYFAKKIKDTVLEWTVIRGPNGRCISEDENKSETLKFPIFS